MFYFCRAASNTFLLCMQAVLTDVTPEFLAMPRLQRVVGVSEDYNELLECTRKVCGDVQIIDHRDSILWTDLGSALLKAIRESLPALGLHALCTVHLEKAVFEAHRSTKKIYRDSIFCDELW